MTDDVEHIVVELQRGQTVLRLTRKRVDGATFSDLRSFYREENGTRHPTKQGVSIRDSELAELIAALTKVATHVRLRVTMGAPPAAQQRSHSPSHRQREQPLPIRQPQDDAVGAVSDDELAEIRRAF